MKTIGLLDGMSWESTMGYYRGAEAVILGCTKIGMLVSQGNTKVKLFDTTAIHAQKAVEYAICGRSLCID